jgi:antitoxin CptB
MDSALNRLRWRCRRGTRELDALLGAWLDRHYDAANDQRLLAFDQLLDAPDPELWDWIMARAIPPRADWFAIIDEVRNGHRV